VKSEDKKFTYSKNNISCILIQLWCLVVDMLGKVEKCGLSDIKLVSKALMLAAKGHAEQQRKSDNSPYINHLIEVMSLLVELAHETAPSVLCAAILHDSLEDTNITQSTILSEFGVEALEMVKALTDDKSLSLERRRQHILDKLPNASDNIRRIKLADVCSNASAIPVTWDEQRLTDYFLWLDQVAALCRVSSEVLYQEYLVRRTNFTS
jgi:(p)ppGpp synthase/HD superfamily hydrolase